MVTTYLQRFLILVISTCVIASTAYAESGRTDYDLDDDGLIEINSLADLNEIRNNLDGTTLYGESGGCPAEGCNGFELTTTLDFDTNADGVMDENDTYWNEGYGWGPIGDYNFPFTAIFDGNGHQIRNLYIDRPSTNYVGLFGYVKGEAASLGNIGLTGKLMSVAGYYYAGGLVGQVYYASLSNSFSTGNVTSRYYAGGLVGRVYNGSLSNSFSTGRVTGYYYVGGLVGSVYNNGSLSDSFATGRVIGEGYVGGLVGHSYATSFINSHWATDTSGQASSVGASSSNDYFGATLAELQCPTSSDNTECVISNTLYASWDAAVWDFGSNQELPGLIINGVVYRDSDSDGVLDDEDAFPNYWAASADDDSDGHPDAWKAECDTECILSSGLTLDQFPATSAARLDADLDGYPDSWAAGCDASCQNDSGLTLDTSLNDVDNDGVIDIQDSDTNGVLNADADSNGLIEVSTLEQLNSVRYNLTGTGRTLTEAGESDSSGCPVVIFEGTLQRVCAGYELTTTLDFDTNADGVMDASDTYWSDGEGWEPVGDDDLPFTGTFDGNGHQIRNLYIDRPTTDYVGLFGYVHGETASLSNLGLTGKLMSVTANGYIGGLAGYVLSLIHI